MSHLSLLWGQLQIHIWVVLFHLNFHCIDIMLTLCYIQNSIFCPITLFQEVSFDKIPSQTEVFLSRQFFRVPTVLCYLQNLTFHPIFLIISILFGLYLPQPYILLFKCNFDSLEWQLGTCCFYVDLETSWKIKVICVPSHYWSAQFSAVNSRFLSFSCVCQIYVAEVLIIYCLQLLPSKILSPHEYQSEVIFRGVNFRSESYSRSIFGL